MNPKTGPLPTQSHPRGRVAYSLIEVMVVAAILSVLVAVTAPTYSVVKKRARMAGCMNTMRGIGTAVMLYASDREHYPYSGHAQSWADWGESLLPYLDIDLKDTKGKRFIPGEPWANGLLQFADGFPGWNHTHLDHSISQGVVDPVTGEVYFPGWNFFTCPGATQSSKHAAQYRAYAQFKNGVHRYAHTYSANEYLMPNNTWGAYVKGQIMPPIRPQDVERPGSVVLMCDTGMSAGQGESDDTLSQVKGIIHNSFDSDPAGAPAQGEVAIPYNPANDTDLGPGYGWPVYSRHNGLCVAVMADGHIQTFKPGELQRRHFVSKIGRTPNASRTGYVEAWYP